MSKDVAEMSQAYQVAAAEQGVPAGYKQTEVGVTNSSGANLNATSGGPQGGGMDSRRIPKGWHSLTISALVEDGRILSGLYKDKKSYGKGTSIIKLGDVFSNDVFNPTTAQRVQAADNEIKNYSVKPNDLIIALASVKLEGVGKVMFISSLQEKTIFDHNVALIRVKEEVNSLLMSYIFKSNYIRSAIASRATQVGTTFLKTSTILEFSVFLPKCKIEQTAIANALSDVDALLSELEKLIAKKQAIKTATMQQLLTGRTRLPQFTQHPDGSPKGYKQSELGEIPEDWDVKSIQDLAVVDPENLSSSTPPDYEFDYISLEQIDSGVLTGTTNYSFATAPSRARRVLSCNDVLVSTVRPNLMSHYFVRAEVKDLVCSTGFSVVRSIKNKLCAGFLYQHLFASVINSQIEMLISGSNYPAINSSDVKRLKIQVGCVKEQTAIATILSDIDAEIQALEHRLNKTRQIKQGMMQELLTGKTRLVKGGSNE